MYILLLLSCVTAKKTEVNTVTSPPSTDVEISQPEEQTTREPPPRLPPESGQISTPSHCAAEEQVVFSCTTIAQSNSGTKIVSLCGELRGKPSDWIQYRFGALGQVEFGLPDLEGRAKIFRIHSKSINCDRDIRWELLVTTHTYLHIGAWHIRTQYANDEFDWHCKHT